ERHELNLIILGRNPLISQQKSAIQEFSIRPRQAIDGPDEDGNPGVLHEGEELPEQHGVAAKKDRGRRLRPEDGGRLAPGRLASETLVDGERLRLIGRIPFLSLLYRRLDDGDLDGLLRPAGGAA